MKETEKICEEIDEEEIARQIVQYSFQGGIISLFGEINEASVMPIADYIIRANVLDEIQVDKIDIIICSHGGTLPCAFALIDVIEGSNIPISTIGLGLAASAALLILMAGHKGKRIITPNTLLLSHQYTSYKYGKQHELISDRKHDELIDKNLINFYKKHSKIKSEKVIREKLLPPSDVWLSSSEALKLGLCDKVVKFDNKVL